MLTQNQIKNLRKLHQRKFRKEERKYIVEGFHGVEEAIRSALGLIELVLLNEDTQPDFELPRQTMKATKGQFAQLSQQKSPEGILAIMKMPDPPIWDGMENDTVFFLDQVQNPSNLGTIIRTSDWFGFRQIILSPNSTEEYNPKCVQASMGSIHRVKIHREGVNFSWDQIKEDVHKVGATMEGENYLDLRKQKNKIILLGNESKGISADNAAKCDSFISIPRVGEAESLNLGIAHGILAASYCEQKC